MKGCRRIRIWECEPGMWCAEWVRPNGKRAWTFHRSEAEALGVG